jgi:hypothetical protein
VRLYLRSADRRPDPPPLPTQDRITVLVGIAVWAVLWVVALVARGWLADTGRDWWIWTPPAAIVLGVLGLRYVRSRTDGDDRTGGDRS